MRMSAMSLWLAKTGSREFEQLDRLSCMRRIVTIQGAAPTSRTVAKLVCDPDGRGVAELTGLTSGSVALAASLGSVFLHLAAGGEPTKIEGSEGEPSVAADFVEQADPAVGESG